MDQEIIAKGILSRIVDQYIREIAQDPHRGIRKLVDMAERTSDGPTQKICYQMMQEMAANQSSPYYEMIHRLVTDTQPDIIKQFGINLGHNAWTFGSGNIRRIIAQNCASVSWVVLIDRTQKTGRIPFAEIDNLISRGRKMEIYAWLLKASDSLDEWDLYTELFQNHTDSVFGLQITPNALTEAILEEAPEITNLMFILNTDEPDWQQGAEQLAKRGLLFSVCRHVSDDSQAEEITDGSWLEELIPFQPLMAFTIADDTLAGETARNIKEYMWNTRLDQRFPILPVDMISDFVIINHLVTHQDILYRINSDGTVSTAEKLQFTKTDMNFRDLFRES